MIIDMLAFVQSHYTAICKKLKYGYVPDIMVDRLEKRLRHCKLIMEHYARLDPNSYTFTLSNRSSNDKFGDPFKDFLSSWYGNKTNNACTEYRLVKP